MRIIKKLYSKDSASTFVSKVFNDVIAGIDIPINFDTLEFNIGYGAIVIHNRDAVIGIDIENPLIKESDVRGTRTLIAFEVFRLYIRRKINRELPINIEDILISREMIKKGLSDDLAYVFYTFLSTARVTNIKSFIKMNLPWIIFQNHDNAYSELFRDYAKKISRTNYEQKTTALFELMKKDLWNINNLKACIETYESVINANN